VHHHRLEIALGQHAELLADTQRDRPAGAVLGRADDVLDDALTERRPDDLAFPEPRSDARSVTCARVTIARALALAAEADGRAYPKPTVGAVVVSEGEVVGEGATEAGGRHGEIVALDEAGERARGSTLYVTMEPCAHHGTTPPCVDRILADGVARVVVASRDPNPEAAGGLERLAAAGVDVEQVDSPAARMQNEAWRVWVSQRRPFVIYKTAVSLDGRLVVPGERWVTGEESRRRVHELRASVDAVAVGMGTVRADAPRLDARGVETPRGQPRRLAFGRGPLPAGSELELRPGALDEELGALAADGVQSLLLEGGPTLAQAFLDGDFVDKLLLFVAPVLAGADGPSFAPRLRSPRRLHHLQVEPVGADVLLKAYVHEP
jgi:diaminohydroxyphosphoribosylaminopyrimidine deaminase / 5-amino-6-(5-phosphoribosylamino)uracil reductase